MFRVVPDQLRISEGWVRCGQCDEIFDASIHLVQAEPEELSSWMPVMEPPHDTGVVDLSNIIPSDEAEVTEVDPYILQFRSPGSDEGSTEAFEYPEEGPASVELVAQDPPVGSVSQVQHPDVVVDAGFETETENHVEIAAPVDANERHEPEAVSFLQGEDKNGFWQHTFMQVIMLVLSTLLFIGLAGQVVFQERDRLAAAATDLVPWLETFCRPFNCSLSPLRHIGSIAIESSSFTKIRGEAYTLSFTLKNSATTPLAVPAMELTLTDSADQAVLRRVFQPSELTTKSGPLAAGAEWSAQLGMVVKATAVADKVVGYRLLAFYP